MRKWSGESRHQTCFILNHTLGPSTIFSDCWGLLQVPVGGTFPLERWGGWTWKFLHAKQVHYEAATALPTPRTSLIVTIWRWESSAWVPTETYDSAARKAKYPGTGKHFSALLNALSFAISRVCNHPSMSELSGKFTFASPSSALCNGWVVHANHGGWWLLNHLHYIVCPTTYT